MGNLKRWTTFSAVLLTVVLVAEYLIAERTAATTLLLYGPQQGWGVLPAVLSVISYRRGEKRLLAVNLLALLVFIGTLAGFNVPVNRSRLPDKPLRVMTYNTHYTMSGIPGVVQTIKSQNPDIVCLQETPAVTGIMHGATAEKWISVMQRRFPGWTLHRAGDVTTMSRFPILEVEKWPLTSNESRALLKVRVQTPEGVLAVFNLHLDNGYELLKVSPMDRLKGAYKDCTMGPIIRRKGFEEVRPHLVKMKEPFLLAGDFNNPPRGQLYTEISDSMIDAFKEAGWGSGNTYPATFPLIRIDYVWLGTGVSAKKCFKVRSQASDHQPVVADILVNAKPFT